MEFSDIIGVKALTWTRISHGLFDYESKQLQKKTLEVKKDCEIVRSEHEVILTEDVEKTDTQTDSENPIQPLVKIAYN